LYGGKQAVQLADQNIVDFSGRGISSRTSQGVTYQEVLIFISIPLMVFANYESDLPGLTHQI
jgi:hypothetical protein